MLLIRNARIVTPAGILAGDCLLVDGKIAAIERAPSGLAAATVIDADGQLLAPGLIDLQINGGFGHDFTRDPATIGAVAAQLPRYGVTAFLPTVITSPPETLPAAQAALRAAQQQPVGARPLGVHLEGPYLNPARRGAHDPTWMRQPAAGEVASWSPANGIRLVTLAPELPGAAAVIARLRANGVVVSAGHSAATYDQALAALEQGVAYGTHLFNAMPPLHQRAPGLIAALLADERVTIGLIPDGVHVHPGLVRLVWQLAGRRLNVVTDAMAAMGWAAGNYPLGGQTVTVDATSARLPDGTLAGSIVTLDQALRNLVAWTDCSVADALATVTRIPAALLGLAHKGRIAPGCDADLVLLDDALQVTLTLVAGKIAYPAV